VIAFLDAEFWGIVSITMQMTLSSTIISTILGIPLGLWLQSANFRGKGLIVNINRTLMAAPPVVVGLVVYLLLMRNGLAGSLGWLFTLQAMIIAQVIIITPIVCATVYSAAEQSANSIRAFAFTMGASKIQTLRLVIKELSPGIYFAIVVAFGRAMSEVGAIMIVGGNIRHRTRTMTTAITMLRGQGDFQTAIWFGIFLMLVAFILQILAHFITRKGRLRNENI